MLFSEVETYINNIYHDRQSLAQSNYNKRLYKALEDPYFAKLFSARSEFITKKATLELAEKDTTLVKKELAKISNEILAYIKLNNIDLNKYCSCPKCRDSGYINGKICVCRKSLKTSLLRNESHLPIKANNISFSSIKYNFDVPQKNIMGKLYTKVQEWVNNFSNSDRDIIMLSGEVGVGKTTLAYATANAILDKGYTIYYSTAFDINTLFVDKQFNRLDNIDNYYNAINSDLLIIDDLGTEGINSIGLEYLFNVIDSRIAQNKKTFIITNLSLEKFSAKYGERVTSRLTNNNYAFAPKHIKGVDLRKI